MPKSREVRRETLDNFENMLRYSAKRIRDWESLHYSSLFSERYKRLDIRIHVHVRGSLSKFCAILQHAPMETAPVGPEGISEVIPSQAYLGPSAPLWRNGRDKSMLVRIVDLFQPVEGIFTPGTASLVWLQPLNHCLMFAADASKHVASTLFKMLDGFRCRPSDEEYRELGSPCGCALVQEHQLVNQPIKGRAKVVRNFPDSDSQIREEWRLARAHAVDNITRLRITLGPDYVVWRVLPHI